MRPLNKTRLILAGLVSGAVLTISEFVINEWILLAEWYTAFSRLGIELDPGFFSTILFISATLGLGIGLIWLYAILSAHFGRGPGAAVVSALFLWLVVHLYTSIWIGLLGILPVRMLVILTVWALGAIILAALAGYGFYRD